MTYKLTPKRIEKMRVLGMAFIGLHEEDSDNQVEMATGQFKVCGTIACHAGWHSIMMNKSRTEEFTFTDAAIEMAKYLEFKDDRDLEYWAAINKKLWGNKNGKYMFLSPQAFGRTYNVTLKDIGLHWLKVADRCEESMVK